MSLEAIRNSFPKFQPWSLGDFRKIMLGSSVPDDQIQDLLIGSVRKRSLVLMGRDRSDGEHREVLLDDETARSLFDFTTNTISVATRARSMIFRDILVYPTLHSPVNVRCLDEMTLKDAFSDFVLNDPQVLHLGRQASSIRPSLAIEYEGNISLYPWRLIFGYGALAGGDDRLSPMRDFRMFQSADDVSDKEIAEYYSQKLNRKMSPQEVAQKWSANQEENDSPLSKRRAAIFAAADALTLRNHSLLELLREGKLVGIGYRVDDAREEHILTSVWSDHRYYFDFRNNTIVRITETEPDPERGFQDFHKPIWRSVMLRDRARVQQLRAEPRADDHLRARVPIGVRFEGGVLNIGDQQFLFRGARQRAFIEQLVEGFETGNPVRERVILELIRSGAASAAQLFRGSAEWNRLRPYISRANGFMRLDLEADAGPALD